MVDRSFGFETAVQECTRAIRSALVEAMSCEYGVGIVTLMGREAGFIAGRSARGVSPQRTRRWRATTWTCV